MATELADLGAGGLWLTITELAKRERVGKPTVSEKVKALEAAGLITSKSGPRRTKLVNLAQYLTAKGNAGDAAAELAAETRGDAPPAEPVPSDKPTYRDAQTRKLQFEADLAELTLRQKLGELVPVAEVEDAAAQFAEAITRVVHRLASHAEAMAAAVGKDGVAGARAHYKENSREILTALADAMTPFTAPSAIASDIPAPAEPTPAAL